MYRRIAIIKTGWSDDFEGSPVEAAHKHVRAFKDGHEKFNFLPGPDGKFYAYTPPVSGYVVAPRPKELEGWLVFAVAKAPRQSGLHLIGWFEDATFEGEYKARPDYKHKRSQLPLDNDGEQYLYTLSSPTGIKVDLEGSSFIFSGAQMKRSSIFYLRGNGDKRDWCETLAKELLAIRRRILKNGLATKSNKQGGVEGGICADSKRRKEVEEAAIAVVKAHFPAGRYEIEDRQMAKCGFDLLIRDRRSAPRELHVEVKGTQNERPHFLMSHREYAYMQTYVSKWRLAMVTNALSKRPKLQILTATEVMTRFFWKEFTWHAIEKSSDNDAS